MWRISVPCGVRCSHNKLQCSVFCGKPMGNVLEVDIQPVEIIHSMAGQYMYYVTSTVLLGVLCPIFGSNF